MNSLFTVPDHVVIFEICDHQCLNRDTWHQAN